MREPLLSDASTTSTPLVRPLIILFLWGKFAASGGVPMGNSDTTAPFDIISWYNFLFSGGYATSIPLPNTAIVLPLPAIAPLCAAESIPLAIPLTIVTPSPAISLDIFSAAAMPYGVGSLVPTIAMALSSSLHNVPFTYKYGGGSGIENRALGKSVCLRVKNVTPCFSIRLISFSTQPHSLNPFMAWLSFLPIPGVCSSLLSAVSKTALGSLNSSMSALQVILPI